MAWFLQCQKPASENRKNPKSHHHCNFTGGKPKPMWNKKPFPTDKIQVKVKDPSLPSLCLSRSAHSLSSVKGIYVDHLSSPESLTSSNQSNLSLLERLVSIGYPGHPEDSY